MKLAGRETDAASPRERYEAHQETQEASTKGRKPTGIKPAELWPWEHRKVKKGILKEAYAAGERKALEELVGKLRSTGLPGDVVTPGKDNLTWSVTNPEDPEGTVHQYRILRRGPGQYTLRQTAEPPVPSTLETVGRTGLGALLGAGGGAGLGHLAHMGVAGLLGEPIDPRKFGVGALAGGLLGAPLGGYLGYQRAKHAFTEEACDGQYPA